MKKTICLILLLVYLVPFTVLAQTSADTQVKRVEQGLLPQVLDKTEPANTAAVRVDLEPGTKKLPEAIAYFKLNAELYPNSSNVYDSLGEAYMANGDKELAMTNYKKSLEPDPKNTNATEALKKLNTQ
jgi:tetratricopeptide (TPR) repeat protein